MSAALFVIHLILSLSSSASEPSEPNPLPSFQGSACNTTLAKDASYELPENWTELTLDKVLSAVESQIQKSREIQASISASVEKPTFANTIAPFLVRDQPVQMELHQFVVLAELLGFEKYPAYDPQIDQLIAAARADMVEDASFLKRVLHVYEERANLSSEDRLATERFFQSFLEAGVDLTSKNRSLLNTQKLRLFELYEKYRTILENAKSELFVHFKSPFDVQGVPRFQKEMMLEAAEERGLAGYVQNYIEENLENAVLFALSERTRRSVFDLTQSLFDNDDYPLTAVVAEILEVRSQIAFLSGQSSFAHITIQQNSDRDPHAVAEALASRLHELHSALTRQTQEVRLWAAERFPNLDLDKPWNFKFVRNQFRMEFYDLNQEKVREYFPLSYVWARVQAHFERLFDVRFEDVSSKYGTWNEDVRVIRVYSGNGEVLGHFYWDPFEREQKTRSDFAIPLRQRGLFLKGGKFETLPAIVVMSTSFRAPHENGADTNLSFPELEYLFHEMGHVMHSMLSKTKWESLAGTNVPKDSLEYPSMLMEYWLQDFEFVKSLSQHPVTVQKISDQMLKDLFEYERFHKLRENFYFHLQSLLDLKVHLHGGGDWSPETLRQLENGIRSPYDFAELGDSELLLPKMAHLFGGGYESNYYSYVWGQVLGAEFWERIQASGNLYDPELLSELREQLSNRGAPFYK